MRRCFQRGCKDSRRRVSRGVCSLYSRMISRRASGLTNDAEKAIAVKASAMHRSCIGLCLYVGDDDARNFVARTQDKRHPSRQLPRARRLKRKINFIWTKKQIRDDGCHETHVSPILLSIKISSRIFNIGWLVCLYVSRQILHFHVRCDSLFKNLYNDPVFLLSISIFCLRFLV